MLFLTANPPLRAVYGVSAKRNKLSVPSFYVAELFLWGGGDDELYSP
jgi:hypothetical protein